MMSARVCLSICLCVCWYKKTEKLLIGKQRRVPTGPEIHLLIFQALKSPEVDAEKYRGKVLKFSNVVLKKQATDEVIFCDVTYLFDAVTSVALIHALFSSTVSVNYFK